MNSILKYLGHKGWIKTAYLTQQNNGHGVIVLYTPERRVVFDSRTYKKRQAKWKYLSRHNKRLSSLNKQSQSIISHLSFFGNKPSLQRLISLALKHNGDINLNHLFSFNTANFANSNFSARYDAMGISVGGSSDAISAIKKPRRLTIEKILGSSAEKTLQQKRYSIKLYWARYGEIYDVQVLPDGTFKYTIIPEKLLQILKEDMEEKKKHEEALLRAQQKNKNNSDSNNSRSRNNNRNYNYKYNNNNKSDNSNSRNNNSNNNNPTLPNQKPSKRFYQKK